jgi:hypothetical protein
LAKFHPIFEKNHKIFKTFIKEVTMKKGFFFGAWLIGAGLSAQSMQGDYCDLDNTRVDWSQQHVNIKTMSASIKGKCQVQIPLNIQAGWTMTVIQTDHRGTVALGDESESVKITSKAFFGPFDQGFGTTTIEDKGPLSTSFEVSHNPDTVRWSGCSPYLQQKVLRLETQVEGTGIELESPANFEQTYHITWRRCSEPAQDPMGNRWMAQCVSYLRDMFHNVPYYSFSGSAYAQTQVHAMRLAQTEAYQNCEVYRQMNPYYRCDMNRINCSIFRSN